MYELLSPNHFEQTPIQRVGYEVELVLVREHVVHVDEWLLDQLWFSNELSLAPLLHAATGEPELPIQHMRARRRHCLYFEVRKNNNVLDI